MLWSAYHCVHGTSCFCTLSASCACIHALNHRSLHGVDFFLEIFLWTLGYCNLDEELKAASSWTWWWEGGASNVDSSNAVIVAKRVGYCRARRQAPCTASYRNCITQWFSSKTIRFNKWYISLIKCRFENSACIHCVLRMYFSVIKSWSGSACCWHCSPRIFKKFVIINFVHVWICMFQYIIHCLHSQVSIYFWRCCSSELSCCSWRFFLKI